MLTLREVWPQSNGWNDLLLEALERLVPRTTIEAVLAEEGKVAERVRKLTLDVMVLVVIAMNLYADRPIPGVLEALAGGIERMGPDVQEEPPGASAFTCRRRQLGARPMAALFHRICRPLATPDTPGAFRFGRRLMAIDGTTEDVPDTPANAAVFGRPGTDRGEGAFPQVKGVYLCECGTHAIVDAGFWPSGVSERTGAFRLLRSIGPDTLVMWDRGFHEYDLVRAARRHRADVLSRLPAHVLTPVVHRLEDGSCLSYLRPSDRARRRRGERLIVRVIEYALTDPRRPGYRERHRLIATLLDPALAPALELVGLYHERWEIELVIDEIDTHQRLAGRPLRSQQPVGVIQELYGMLIAHFLVRSLMHEAAVGAGIDPDRLSFAGALRALGEALPFLAIADPTDRPRLYERLLRRIARARLPERRNRLQPRVVRRKMSNFPLKRHKHRRWPPLILPFSRTVALI